MSGKPSVTSPRFFKRQSLQILLNCLWLIGTGTAQGTDKSFFGTKSRFEVEVISLIFSPSARSLLDRTSKVILLINSLHSDGRF